MATFKSFAWGVGTVVVGLVAYGAAKKAYAWATEKKG